LTEVPEHLLQRSRDRRKALGLGDDDDGAAPGTAAAATPAAAAPVAAAPAAAPVPIEAAPPLPPEPPKPWVQAALSRKKIPYWAMPVLLFLPIWAFLYVGTLEGAGGEAEGLVAEGEQVYEESCASCHGAEGGGGVGPALAGGDVLTTFPEITGHIEWVAQATAGLGEGTPYGSPDVGRVAGANGIMPSFVSSLTAEELIAVVIYERTAWATDENEVTIVAAIEEMIESGEIVLPETFPEDVSAEDIAELLAPALAESAETAAG
jgi:mono/diheme cytochrome c family protein